MRIRQLTPGEMEAVLDSLVRNMTAAEQATIRLAAAAKGITTENAQARLVLALEAVDDIHAAWFVAGSDLRAALLTKEDIQ
jgi:hypothetical protein